MKLSLVFELLMIFVLLAFAASKSVKHQKNNRKGIRNKSDSTEVELIEDNSINKYCKCVEAYCNCCRDFALPLVNLNGPGCASLTYLNGDKMAVSLSFGKKVISNRTLSSRKPSPVCMPLPGGLSKFCGRVYNIARSGEEFRACLGLELQSKKVVEAAVRVSCFKFGPKGVTSEPADPLPLITDEKGDKDDDDDDEDDDDYGLGGDDDDDDDDEADDDDDDDGEIEAVNDVGSSDYTGFSLLEDDLLGEIFGGTSGKKGNKNKHQNKIKKKQAPISTTTKRPRRTTTRRPSTRKPSTRNTTPRPIKTTTVKIRPVNKRPTRRPTRRPVRPNRTKPTVQTTEFPPPSIVSAASPTTTTTSTTTTTTTTTAVPLVTAPVRTNIQVINDNVASTNSFEPIIAIRQSTTPKSVTDFEQTGLEMSLAHITGQLSSIPVIPLENEPKDSGMATKPHEHVTYQKVEMITPKAPTTVPMANPTPHDIVNDDMIEIVETLDSTEALPSKEVMSAEESRAYFYNHPVSRDVINAAFTGNENRPKQRQVDDLGLPDLDIIGLTQIGESIGDELGLFGGKNRAIKEDGNKVKDDSDDYSEYDEVMDTMGDALLLARKSGIKRNNKKKIGRQNKMMHGDWA